MIDPLQTSLTIAASGLQANSARLRVASENIANARSTGATPGSDPYRRKTITFESALDDVSGADLTKVADIGVDRTPFTTELDPGNPAADSQGFVKLPNVNLILEMADMREANRAYEANLQVVKQSRDLISMTIDLLKGIVMIAALPLVTTAISSLLGPDQAVNAAKTTATSGAGDSFSDMLASLSQNTVDKLNKSESMSVAGIQGKATTQSVVQAVMTAQESLQTVLAIRDKAVSAFQEISRMPV